MASEPLPRAVATGAATRGSDGDAVAPVSPRRVGLAAGVLAALYLFVLYLAHPVPDAALALVGGTDALARTGGLHMVWTPPAGYDPHRLVGKLGARDASVSIDGGDVVLDIARVAQRDLDAVADRIAHGQLEFHRVIETEEMKRLPAVLHLPLRGAAPVDLDVDQWRTEDGGPSRSDMYLVGERAAIEGKLAEAAAVGWRLPPHTHIAYERLARPARTDAWRTYVVSDIVEADGDDISDASGAYDPNTERPIVLVTLTRAAAARFGDLTAEIAGHKLATLLGGEVRSAPIVNGPIRGGRVSIAMGGGEPAAQERERDLLVDTLRTGALPAGGSVKSVRYVEPSVGGIGEWIARLSAALGGGLVIGLAAFGLVRATRPVRVRLAPRAAGRVPWVRVAITLIAPALVLVEGAVPVPGVDLAMARGPGIPVVLGTLGMMPIVAAYISIELIAMIVPGWRRRRHAGADARRPLDHAVVAAAVALVAIQAWLVTRYLESADMLRWGALPRLEVMATLAVGTLAFAGAARLIRARGIGNGYSALIAADFGIRVLRHWFDVSPLSGDRVVAAMTLVAIAVPVVTVLGWRVGNAREAALRVPASGTPPLSDAGGLAALAIALTTLPVTAASMQIETWAGAVHRAGALALALVAALTVLWSLAFARPAVLAPLAVRAGLAPPAREAWLRATAVSAALLLALAAIARAAPEAMWIAEPAGLALVIATLLDARADLRGHRAALVRVWSLHQPQYADLAARHLADADIACHQSATNARTLLAWFGPFAPIDVWVAPAHAEAARARLAALFAP